MTLIIRQLQDSLKKSDIFFVLQGYLFDLIGINKCLKGENPVQLNLKVLIQFISKKPYQMKILSDDLRNISVLSEIEMSKIFGGDNTTATTEDDEAWL